MSFSTSMLSLSSILLGATGLLLLHSDASAARAGFVLSFGLDISLQLFWLLDRVVNFEENMVSVERIAESEPVS
jgi:energy-converting hydrogenase A subunit M